MIRSTAIITECVRFKLHTVATTKYLHNYLDCYAL